MNQESYSTIPEQETLKRNQLSKTIIEYNFFKMTLNLNNFFTQTSFY